MKLRLVTTICTIASAMMAAAQGPSLINYQGRLTDADGAPVTGSKNFSISIYDAATAGNLLYTESIGAVTLDSNGVYSFQFGSAGTSNKQVTETIGTTAGTTLVYSKALANSSVVNNSITVTDGTNSWSQSVGNPGAGATATANTIAGFVIGATITNGGSGYTSPPNVTIIGNGSGATATAVLTEGVVTGITITSAGSGYTGTPTITIAPPVIPFRVDYSAGAITATYASAPTAGRTITATYRYGTSGITGALSSGAEHWMAVSVDGTPQGVRQRVLAVPFAANSSHSNRANSAGVVDPRTNVRLMVSQLVSPPDVTAWTVSMPATFSIGGGLTSNKGSGGVFNIPKTARAVRSISCATFNKTVSGISGGYSSVTTGHTTVSFRSRSGTGIINTLATQTISGQDQNILLDNEIELDHSNFEYFVQIEFGISSTNGQVSTPNTEMAKASNLVVTIDSY